MVHGSKIDSSKCYLEIAYVVFKQDCTNRIIFVFTWLCITFCEPSSYIMNKSMKVYLLIVIINISYSRFDHIYSWKKIHLPAYAVSARPRLPYNRWPDNSTLYLVLTLFKPIKITTHFCSSIILHSHYWLNVEVELTSSIWNCLLVS